VKIRNKITNTYPIAFHMSGLSKWNRLGQRIHRLSKKLSHKFVNIRPDLDLCFLSYGYDNKSMVENSLSEFGLSIVNLNDYIELSESDTFGDIKATKLTALKKYLESTTKKYIIGQDASDVFFINHPNLIVEIFEKKFECELLMNGETNIFPDDAKSIYNRLDKRSDYKDKNRKFKFLNSGLFVAKVDFLKKIIDELIATPYIGDAKDQGQFQQIYEKYYPKIQVDVNCEIFQTTVFRKRDRGKDNKFLEIEE
jgi:hypothetical protein